MPTVSVLIPTYKAAGYLDTIISSLRMQALAPTEIIIIDSSSPDATAEKAAQLGCTVQVIPQRDFNHGGTRNKLAELATGDILVYMTQDALPVDEHYIANLVAPIADGNVAASYARQTTPPDANPLEAFSRAFNYPLAGHVKSKTDIETMGVKAYFFSDAASAVRRELFWAVGGFPDWVIVNEDMVLCAKLLQADHKIAYVADAAVYHAHNYRLAQVFRRYFDIGVFMHQSRDVLIGAKSGGEGLRFALAQLRYLQAQRRYGAMIRSIAESGLKWVAFQLGKRSRFWPLWFNRFCSGQKAYWATPSE